MTMVEMRPTPATGRRFFPRSGEGGGPRWEGIECAVEFKILFLNQAQIMLFIWIRLRGVGALYADTNQKMLDMIMPFVVEDR